MATRCHLWTCRRTPPLRIQSIQQALSMKWCLDFCALLVAQTFFLMTHLEAPPPLIIAWWFLQTSSTRQGKWACPTTILLHLLLLFLLLSASAFQEHTMTFPSSSASPLSPSLPITAPSPPPCFSELGKELQKFQLIQLVALPQGGCLEKSREEGRERKREKHAQGYVQLVKFGLWKVISFLHTALEKSKQDETLEFPYLRCLLPPPAFMPTPEASERSQTSGDPSPRTGFSRTYLKKELFLDLSLSLQIPRQERMPSECHYSGHTHPLAETGWWVAWQHLDFRNLRKNRFHPWQEDTGESSQGKRSVFSLSPSQTRLRYTRLFSTCTAAKVA